MEWSLTHCLYLEPHVSRSLIIGRPLHLLQMVTKGWEPDRIPVQYAHNESPGGGAISMQGWAAVGQPNKSNPKQQQALGLFCCTLKCFSVRWQSVPLVPATQEAEAEGLLMPRNSRPVWTTEQDPCLKNNTNLNFVHAMLPKFKLSKSVLQNSRATMVWGYICERQTATNKRRWDGAVVHSTALSEAGRLDLSSTKTTLDIHA